MHVQSQFVCLHIHIIHADRNIIYTYTNIYSTYKYNTCTCKHTTCTCKYNTCTNKYKTYIIWIYMNMLIWICIYVYIYIWTHIPQNLCALEPASLACFTMVMASSTRPTFLDTLELPLVFVHLCPPLGWTMLNLMFYDLFMIVWRYCLDMCNYNVYAY